MEGRPLEEHDLITRACAGDGAAFSQLVQHYQDLAFRTAYLIVGDPAEAADAAQDGFVNAYHALGRFRPTAAFRPWLLQIVANAAKNRRRAAGRRAHLALRAASASAAEDAAPSPEATALAAEQRQVLLAAVNALRDDDRLVIACRYFLELSEAETAALMGCAQGTVKSRLARALGRLRQHLAQTPDLEASRG